MTDVEEHEPRGNLVACALVIFLVDLACTKKLFAPALIGTSNGAGWAGWLGTLLFTGLAGFGLAERHRCCIAKRHRAAAANRSLLLTGRVNAAHAGQQQRPEVFAAGAPTEQYADRCAAVAAALERALLSERQPQMRADLERYLARKHGLWHCPPPGVVTVATPQEDADGELEEEHGQIADAMDEHARALRTLALRYPWSATPLAQSHFKWAPGQAPLRVDGDAALDAAMASWTDTTTSAADSALFSSLGMWVSPFTMPLTALAGLGFGVLTAMQFQLYEGIFPLQLLENGLMSAVLLATATLLWQGRRPLATACWVWGCMLIAACFAMEGALVLCRCWGAYSEEAHARTGNEGVDATSSYPSQDAVRRIGAAVAVLPLVALATHPHRSFELLFVACPVLQALAVCPYLTDYARFSSNAAGAITPAALMLGIGAFLGRRRSRALKHGKLLGDTDAKRYTALWENELLPRSRDELRELLGAWRAAQLGAAPGVARRQLAAGVGALFREADTLNDLLHAKLFDVCVAHGGTFHRSDVKKEARAMQKTFRTYGGRWDLLNDLCRASLVFETVPQMAACLRAISKDAELRVVLSRDDKMRLRDDFDAQRLSGGYRDVQLTVLLNTDEARARKVDRHLAEVQLHLASILALKSAGGHKSYVLRRNLRGQ
jgi:hypothetical protein